MEKNRLGVLFQFFVEDLLTLVQYLGLEIVYCWTIHHWCVFMRCNIADVKCHLLMILCCASARLGWTDSIEKIIRCASYQCQWAFVKSFSMPICNPFLTALSSWYDHATCMSQQALASLRAWIWRPSIHGTQLEAAKLQAVSPTFSETFCWITPTNANCSCHPVPVLTTGAWLCFPPTFNNLFQFIAHFSFHMESQGTLQGRLQHK